MQGPFDYEGPYPDFDYCGYEVAVEILLYSTQPGKHGRDYLQFDTIRKFQSTFGNVLKASPRGASKNWGLLDEGGRYKRLVDDPCASYWFKRFLKGCKRRMAQDWRANQALSIKLVLELLARVEVQIREAKSAKDTNKWVTAHCYIVISFVLSLRGPE